MLRLTAQRTVQAGGRCAAAAEVQIAELSGLLGLGPKKSDREMSGSHGQAFSCFSVRCHL